MEGRETTGKTTARMDAHRAAVHRVARWLRRHGHRVVIHLRRSGHVRPGDLYVDGRLWVAVRAAAAGQHVHLTTAAGRVYGPYHYERINFSPHSPGRHPVTVPHLYALVASPSGDIHWLTALEVGERLTVAAHVDGRMARCRGRECGRCAELALEGAT